VPASYTDEQSRANQSGQGDGTSRTSDRAPRPLEPPQLTLPKGGGAIASIGEKYSVQAATGTLSATIPIFTTEGRDAFGPRLALSYDSGAGNGPFGLGWQLSVPSVARSTDKRLPRYRDATDAEDADTFSLSGSDYLVPLLTLSVGSWVPDLVDAGTHVIRRYRPRMEAAFERIEMWKRKSDGDLHWRSVSRSNVTNIFGRSPLARIADPSQPGKVFRWLLEEVRDDRGNVATYEYKPEDLSGVRQTSSEAPRLDATIPVANCLLKRIHYGNLAATEPGHWCFEVVFDYGEHDLQSPRPLEDVPWLVRLDAFSTFKSGFDLRNYRLCRRVLMFHTFTELGATPCLVRSTDLKYTEDAVVSLLTNVTQTGYIRTAEPATYTTASTPSVSFAYSLPTADPQLHVVDTDSVENLPVGIDETGYRWQDLDSEGIAGILSERAGDWYYKRNLGGGTFAPLEVVASRPGTASLDSPRQHLVDLAGDGHKYMVAYGEPLAGFYSKTAAGWSPFTAFESSPLLSWTDPNLKFIDLNGDGLSDVLLTEDQALVWHESLGLKGYSDSETVAKGFDEEAGPTLVFDDPTQSVYLADMTGDGLTDLVRIRNGEVSYWPNLGYGRFGGRILMESSPVFDARADEFDPRRLRVGDVDGYGPTDLVYLGRDTTRYWINRSGNSWSESQPLDSFPDCDDVAQIALLDLLGRGTSCLVRSSPIAGDVGRPMSYIDLIAGDKPYLLNAIFNGQGGETRCHYAPSTQFYLEDRLAGRPWATRLPFPVHVVDRVEVDDRITKSRFTTKYAYHHGYYDGPEREFRGFGLVEQWDAADFADYVGEGLFSSTPEAVDQALHVPPILTRSWFHTGAYIDEQEISDALAAEYYSGDPQAPPPQAGMFPSGLSPVEQREARRALKGRPLRQEVYAEDGSPNSLDPYQVSQTSYTVAVLQPRSGNQAAAFQVQARDAVELNYERNPTDPRITQKLVLNFDAFGNVTESASIAYPRRVLGEPEQAHTWITTIQSDLINLASATFYRVGLAAETRTYELTGLPRPAGATWTTDELLGSIATAAEIPYEADPAPPITQKRLIACVRQTYWKDDLSAELPVGQAESLGLAYQTYTQAFTQGLIAAGFGGRVSDTMLADAGYVLQGTDWWVPSGYRHFDPVHFYVPDQLFDPFASATLIGYDTYWLRSVHVQDVLGNSIQSDPEYRLVLPYRITDANGNVSEVAFDALGQVTALAQSGKPGGGEGSTIDDPSVRFDYDLFAWINNGRPAFTHSQAREQYGSANPRWQDSYVYFDGLGRELMRKVQAEPGLAPERDAAGNLVYDSAGHLVYADTTPAVRWVGSGRTVRNNKGLVIKQYEPFFSSVSDYENEVDLVQSGVTPLLHYDPPGRLVRTDSPDGSYATVEFDAWQQKKFDANDDVLGSRWYADRMALPPSDPQYRAAQLTAQHSNTPLVLETDGLGRVFLTVADNGSYGPQPTRLLLDVQGNQRTVTDAKNRVILTQVSDMVGHAVDVLSPDAGESWTLVDLLGKPVHGWDSRGVYRRSMYDQLRRVTHAYATVGANAESLVERSVYGEALATPETINMRTRIYQVYDSAGLVTNSLFDFKGNLLQKSRQLGLDPHATPDWSALATLTDPAAMYAVALPSLDPETFTATTAFDALDRLTSLNTPDGSVTNPGYNEANLLETVDVSIRGAAAITNFVSDIDYNAKGQRLAITYAASGVTTSYSYDQYTFRLARVQTTRASDGAALQDLSYTFDPIGNVMELDDAAQDTVFFANAAVAPNSQYVYDPVYRLIKATGREHPGQTGHDQPDQAEWPLMPLVDPNNPQAMRSYTETYGYDLVGNFQQMNHSFAGGGWSRLYDCADPTSNRLTSTSLPGDPPSTPYSQKYTYDAAGNMTSMPHLASMTWDAKNRLQQVDLGGGGTAYYVYDAVGQRVRKVVERLGGDVEDRIYVGGYEVFRRTVAGTQAVERQSLHVMDGQRRVALVETKTRENGVPVALPVSLIRYQLSNMIDSACVEFDEAGALISYEEYFAFGGTSYRSVRRDIDVPLKRYRYVGKERDDETALYYYGARYYSPWLGRWISPDPAGLKDGTSFYVYTRDNPVRLVDPTGRQADHPSGDEQKARLSQITSGIRAALRGAGPVGGDVHTAQSFHLSLEAPSFRLSGKPLSGTLHLWSGDPAGKALAKAAAKLEETGFIMGATPEHAAAVEAVKARGPSFTNDEWRGIWDPPSAQVTRRAVLAENPVATHNPAGPGPVQLEVERPMVRRGGTFSGAVTVLSGAANIYSAAHVDNTAIKAIGMAGGAAEVAGGVSYAAGALQVGTSAGEGLMKLGTNLSRYGGGVATTAVSGYLLYRDWQRGDVAHGVGDVAGTATGVLTVAGAIATNAGWAAGAAGAASGAAVAGAFGAGYGVGTLINEHLLSEDIKTAIGGTLNEIINEGGWKHPFGIGM